jgi:hypothetical protein
LTKPVVGRVALCRHTRAPATNLAEDFAPVVVFVASGMTLFIGLVARYDIGGPLWGHQMSGARPIKRITPDATR